MVEAGILDFLFGGPVEAIGADESPLKAGKPLKAVRPNAGIAAEYRRRLEALIDEMNTSLVKWISAAYRKAPPEIAQDELSSSAMRAAMRKLAARWNSRFDDMAEQLAAYFAQSVSKRSDAVLKKILKDGGMSIEWTMTRAQRDVVNAIVNENVSLIKSIPQEHLVQVEGAVMRSVATGRDLAQLTTDLQKQFGVTRRRAVLISRDQNNKATAMLTRARQVELGVEECIWMHSHGGRHPRPSHMRAGRDKARFDPRIGWFDPDEGRNVLPGELINCRCVSRPVIRGIGG